MSYVDGLASGLNTTSIIQQLMQIERQPQLRLAARRTQTEAIATAIGGISGDITKLRTLAADLRATAAWQGLKATSSSPDVLVTARSGQATGTIDVRVQQTAAAHTIYSNEAVSLDTVVVGGSSLLTADGIGALGFSGIASTGAVTDGPLTVTQSSAAAGITGSTAPTTPLTITTSNNQLKIALNGVNHTLTLATGTYDTPDALAAALDGAISAAGLSGELDAGVDAGKLRLATVHEGSAHSLQITNSSARTALGFGSGGALSATGVDGIVSFGGSTATITDTRPPAQVAIGNLTATIGGPIRAGTAQVRSLDIGTGTLSEVIQAINAAAGLGFRAAAVNTGSGYRLQLTASKTGADSTVGVDRSQFTYSGFSTLTEGRDAELVVEGATPYTITSASNTFTDLLPGVDATVVRPTAGTATITVGHDTGATADKVAGLVDQLNAILGKLDAAAKADPSGASRGPLVGSSEVRRARQALVAALTHEVGGALGAVGRVGITMQRDGKVGFDRDAFLAAAEQDPQAIQELFVGTTGDLADGVVDRLVNAATAATATTTGYLTSAQDGAKNRVQDLTRQIDVLERRYAAKELQYRRSFSALETALSGLQSQSNWLSGQLGTQAAG